MWDRHRLNINYKITPRNWLNMVYPWSKKEEEVNEAETEIEEEKEEKRQKVKISKKITLFVPILGLNKH